MSICPSCEGVIGRDCFNPEEGTCITRRQANQLQKQQEEIQEIKHKILQYANEGIELSFDCDVRITMRFERIIKTLSNI